MIPEVSEQMKEVFETEYPIAECTVAIGFFFVLLLEQIVTRKGPLVSNSLGSYICCLFALVIKILIDLIQLLHKTNS